MLETKDVKMNENIIIYFLKTLGHRPLSRITLSRRGGNLVPGVDPAVHTEIWSNIS